jgi:large repetitive protein
MARRWLIALILASTFLVPSAAQAQWGLGGAGSAYSKASALAPGSAPVAVASGRNVSLTWSASAGVPAGGYLVSRYDASNAASPVAAGCSGTVAATTCTEKDLPPGQWHYTVTPARGNWRGSASASSNAVTIAPAALTLGPASVGSLPATLTGQISGFLEAQAVTYRLDDPATGTTLSATTTPSTTPASGVAGVSLTVPAGTADGTHTIFAVGSRGDVAQATVTVAAACSAPGAQTIGASQDAYVDSLLSAQNFGTATILEVGPAYLLLLAQQKALVKFELPEVPARCSLVGASLRLFATKPNAGRTMEALPIAAAWTEAGVTWANQPATSGMAASSASLASAGWQTWTVLDQVKAMYSGANNGFLVKDSVAGGLLAPHQTYQSREGAPSSQAPQLVLSFG